MQFEHLVQVNDLSRTDIPALSRAQLWEGLLDRAYDPLRFIVGLERFEILVERAAGIRRRLYLPGVTVEDEVTFQLLQSIHFEVEANAQAAGGSLTISIEEPEPNALFVRFAYCTDDQRALGEELPYDVFIQQAYIAMDIETIQLIRAQFAAQGER